MNEKLVSLKKFVVRHKVPFAVVATVLTYHYINVQGLKQHNDFLKEHNLYTEFYTPED
jgi:hypothetical protein